MSQDYFPGTTVRIFDPSLYRDDISTPLSMTMKLATVLRWYGKKSTYNGVTCTYESLIDVHFWHGDRESKGHFADKIYAEIIAKPSINETIDNFPLPRRQLFKSLLWDAFKGGSAHA